MKWIKTEDNHIFNCDYIESFTLFINSASYSTIEAKTNDKIIMCVYKCPNEHECSVIFDRLCEFLNDGRRKFLNLKF